MYRNIYLESYKNHCSNNLSVEVLLTHFNHVYSTLGSILYDIEFAFGKIMLKNSSEKETINYPQRQSTMTIQKQMDKMKRDSNNYRMPIHPVTPPKQKEKQKEKEKERSQMSHEEIADQMLKAQNSGRNERPIIGTSEFERMFHEMGRNNKNQSKPGTRETQRREEKQTQGGTEEDFFDKMFNNQRNDRAYR